MKIEVARENFLSNYEVYNYMLDVQRDNNWTFTLAADPDTKPKKRKRTTDSLIDLEIITRDLSGYLVKNNQTQSTDPNRFVQLMQGLNKFELEKIEKLQIVNYLPRSMVTLYALIEECDQRFDEDQCNEMLELISTLFPVEEEEGDEEEGDGEEGEYDEEGMEGVEPAGDDEDDGVEVADELEHEPLYGKVADEDPKEIDE
ncbi:unnamed protein product [Ambrosiozyma monospora]|uniref:Unnamed protein product n=1 Tax=Ambrosiozyma monospora TaxID=43982 RepID=A0ACB5TKK8_AMBMO|nr:unnamed protein product [Ambrosiozyma monospora]